jgi:hypothetical protein
MSAPEEDKAEIYAGLFRHAPALLHSDDHIIAMKAHEMKYVLPLLHAATHHDAYDPLIN